MVAILQFHLPKVPALPGSPCVYTDSSTYSFELITGPGSCRSVQDFSTVTIYSFPIVDAGPDQAICAGATVALKGTVVKMSIDSYTLSQEPGVVAPEIWR